MLWLTYSQDEWSPQMLAWVHFNWEPEKSGNVSLDGLFLLKNMILDFSLFIVCFNKLEYSSKVFLISFSSRIFASSNSTICITFLIPFHLLHSLLLEIDVPWIQPLLQKEKGIMDPLLQVAGSQKEATQWAINIYWVSNGWNTKLNHFYPWFAKAKPLQNSLKKILINPIVGLTHIYFIIIAFILSDTIVWITSFIGIDYNITTEDTKYHSQRGFRPCSKKPHKKG